MKNWFDTLNAALESENLLDTWQMDFPPISYGQTFSYTHDDGSKYGRYVSIYRDDSGRYERPISYKR